MLQPDVRSELAIERSAAVHARQQRISIVARARAASVERCWNEVAQHPRFEWLRKPETGLVMVRGRIGGTGDPFNLGEMTVTRCAVKINTPSTRTTPLAEPRSGVGYVPGRAPRHALIAALVDALLQDQARCAEIEDRVIVPLAEELARRDEAQRSKSDTTRVDFQTLVRGE